VGIQIGGRTWCKTGEGRGVGTYNGVNPKRKEAQMGREKERKAGGRVGIA